MEKYFIAELTDDQIRSLKAQFGGNYGRTTIWSGAWKGQEVPTDKFTIGLHKWVKEPEGSWHYAGTESRY